MARPLLKPHASLFSGLMRLCDPLLALAVAAVVYAWYRPINGDIDHYAVLALAAALLITVLFPLFDVYAPLRGQSLFVELRRLGAAWLVLAALVASALFLTKLGVAYSRVFVVAWLASGCVAALALRASLRIALRRFRAGGRNLRHVAIVGAGDLGARVAQQLEEARGSGLRVVGFYDDAVAAGTAVAGRPVLGSADQLRDDIPLRGIDQVWLALPLRAEARMRELLAMLREHAVDVRFVPDIFGFHLLNHSLTEIAGLPVISLTATPMTGGARLAKRIEDCVLGTLLVVLTLPLMLVIALVIRLTSAGPVLYRQARVTWNGEHFPMLKFRTMPVTAETATGAVWSRHGENRATPFGALLRRTSLDELPQFFNVLRGEMSLVGPRPERPEFVAQFRQAIPGYMQKHLVKAGITGWAQVNDLRGDSDLARRIEYDLYYIDHWSLGFDLRILAMTLAHLFASRNAH
ncbi:MAG: undecaprenyl-phosphate glucose phosphotransferase [Proteobacteria bacterium]|nr:undecaprenyl-phosphate glucose phosphotransferase [Pseudomonadota bacterium]